MRPPLIVLAALGAIACGTSHPTDPRCIDGACPDGLVCVPYPEGPVPVCVASCAGLFTARCGNGAWCARNRRVPGEVLVCWPGGTLGEGVSTTSSYACGFGLIARPDYSGEPIRYTCEPVCSSDAHCRAGERCTGNSCDVPCEGPSSVPCTPPNRCVGGFCVNERRFARIDCNGDGVVGPGDPDCRPAFVCDDTAIGGCGFPEPGTE